MRLPCETFDSDFVLEECLTVITLCDIISIQMCMGIDVYMYVCVHLLDVGSNVLFIHVYMCDVCRRTYVYVCWNM